MRYEKYYFLKNLIYFCVLLVALKDEMDKFKFSILLQKSLILSEANKDSTCSHLQKGLSSYNTGIILH